MMFLSKRVEFLHTHAHQVLLKSPGDGSPLHFFQLLITDEMLDDVVSQTRLYASQFIAIGPHSRVQQQ